jgi:hypothetical protein
MRANNRARPLKTAAPNDSDCAELSRGDSKAALAEGLLIGAVLSLAILAINPNWFFTNPFLPPWFDPFVYQGLFMHPREYISAHPGYYPATRIPFIAVGAAFYAALPPVAANIALKITLYTSTVGFFYATARLCSGRSAALFAAIALATYPFFIMSMGWDYVDAAVNLMSAACYFAAGCGARRSTRWPVWEFVAGLAFAILVACNLFAIMLGPSILLFYLASLYSADMLGMGRGALFRRVAAGLVGIAAGLVAHAVAFQMYGGSTLLALLAQWSEVAKVTTQGNGQWAFQNWQYLHPHATWLAVPLTVAIISVVNVVGASRRIAGSVFDKKDVFVLLISAHYLLLLSIFCVITVYSVPVLMFWFYASYLNIPGFLTVACAFAYVGRKTHSKAGWAWPLAAVPLLAIDWPTFGIPLQRLFAFRFEEVSLTTALACVAAAFGIILTAAIARFRHVAILGVLVLSVGYLSMITNAQLNYLHTGDRAQGLSAVIAAAEEIRSVSGNPRHFLWIDRNEPNFYGGLFHAAFVQSHLAAKSRAIGFDQTTRFPDLPPHGFQAGDPIIILTTRSDWQRAADEHLRMINLALQPTRVRTIAYGDVRFEAIVAKLALAPQ